MPALSSWMRQMERYPQLTAAAQNELAAVFQDGQAASRELKANPKIGVREERVLRDRVHKGERAIEYLVASNFRLVVLIAREKAEARWGRERAAEAIADLVGQGNIALMDAAATFNPSAGPSFPTYAATKVRHAVLMVIGRDHPVRVPPSWARLKRIVAVHKPSLVAELGREPTRAELVERVTQVCMEWAFERLTPSEKQLPQAERERIQQDRLRKQGMLGAIENMDEVLVQTQSVSALDAPLREDGSTMGEMLVGESNDMLAGLQAEELKEAVASALSSLPEREQQIIAYRYGFVDGECWPYQKISVLYGVSAERIRQIEKAAIAKLGEGGIGAYWRGDS